MLLVCHWRGRLPWSPVPPVLGFQWAAQLGLGGHYSLWVPPACGLNYSVIVVHLCCFYTSCPAGIKVSDYRMSKESPEMFNRECFAAQTQSAEVLEKDKWNPKTQDQPFTVSLYVTTTCLFSSSLSWFLVHRLLSWQFCVYILFEGCSFSSLTCYDHLTHSTIERLSLNIACLYLPPVMWKVKWSRSVMSDSLWPHGL